MVNNISQVYLHKVYLSIFYNSFRGAGVCILLIVISSASTFLRNNMSNRCKEVENTK